MAALAIPLLALDHANLKPAASTVTRYQIIEGKGVAREAGILPLNYSRAFNNNAIPNHPSLGGNSSIVPRHCNCLSRSPCRRYGFRTDATGSPIMSTLSNSY